MGLPVYERRVFKRERGKDGKKGVAKDVDSEGKELYELALTNTRRRIFRGETWDVWGESYITTSYWMVVYSNSANEKARHLLPCR